ncbi:RPL23 [Ecytonucleospora hepatopenaei]|uniref:Large ribosomal subunit protein uL14 n=1 Tax=Ecytonucleospora hepatopenaei TaxID=646526 RepID=A0A1W0E9C2_9MICR|nr:RPL23 [Ecytonucleospora hepatopenaei]
MAKEVKAAVVVKRDALPKKARANMTRGVQTETRLRCVDNSGAKEVKIIGIKNMSTRLNTIPKAAPGDVVVVSVKKGKPELRKKVVLAIVVRQKKTWKRKDGVNICFEDNACVLIDPKGQLKGTQIAGPIPREVAEAWPKIASQASSID